MIVQKSTKAVVALLIIVLVASMIGVIPSTKVSAQTTIGVNDLNVGDILYPGDEIINNVGGYGRFQAICAFSIKDSFTNETIITENSADLISDSYLQYGDGMPSLDGYGYDAWKLTYIKNYKTSSLYDSVFLIFQPVKDIHFNKHPSSQQVDNGKAAKFTADAKATLKTNSTISYKWYAVNETSFDEMNFYARKNSYGSIGDGIDITLNKKTILQFNRELSQLDSSDTAYFSGYNGLYISKYNDDIDTDIVYGNEIDFPINVMHKFILEPGKYNITYNWQVNEDTIFRISNSKLIELTPISSGNTLTLGKGSQYYKNGQKFLCIVNDKEISNIATLKINSVKPKLEKIHTPKKTLYLKKGQKATIPVYAYKTDGTKEKLTFTSSKKKVATVNKKTGKVKAKKAGTTTITAKASSGAKYKIKVKVTKKATKLKKLKIKGAPKTMNVGATKYLSLTSEPAKATKVIAKWTSSNKSVISIAQNGRIKAKKTGIAKITAKIGKKKVTKTIKVN